MEPIRILAVVGPTAVGKSAYAVELAKRLKGEILSCDSMQVYRGMDIGTAKPTAEERGDIPHHLIDIAEPDQPFSGADYVEKATLSVQEITARGNLPIFCGGTGLYLDRFLFGGVAAPTVEDAGIREELLEFAKVNGNEALHRRLKEIDPASAAAIHPNNVRRVARALEIYLSTGTPKSVWEKKTKEESSPYAAEVIGLTMERTILNQRIDERVENMIRAGLIEETERLEARGVFEKNTTAAQAIGYKEILPYLHGECSKADAIGNLKTATHRYAKRQMTWFCAKDYVKFIEVTPKA